MIEGNQKYVSPAWLVASKIEAQKAKCKFCPKTFDIPRGNTSIITNHARDNHPGNEQVKRALDILAKNRVKNLEKRKEKKRKLDAEKTTQPSMLKYAKIERKAVDAASKEEINILVRKLVIEENLPFGIVESGAFRELLARVEQINGSYICQSRRSFTIGIDEEAKNLPEKLRKELEADLEDCKLKVWSVTADHGQLRSVNKEKVMAITVSRISKNFELKTDTLALPLSLESQTARVCKQTLKTELEKVGWTSNILINLTTDGGSNLVAARRATCCPELEITISHQSTCVDHLITNQEDHTLNHPRCYLFKASVAKVRAVVNHLKDSLPARQELAKIQESLGLEQLSVIQGTTNRYSYQWTKIN